MQLHSVSLELLDGILQIPIGTALLLCRRDIVFRLTGHVETAVLKGDALFFLGSLHNTRRGPKQGVVADFIDGLQHVVAYVNGFLERHLFVSEVEQQIP